MKKVFIVVLCLLVAIASLFSNTTIKTNAQEEPQPYEAPNNVFNWQQLKNIIDHEREFYITLSYENAYLDNFISTGYENVYNVSDIVLTMLCDYTLHDGDLYLNIKYVEFVSSLDFDGDLSLLYEETEPNISLVSFNLDNYILYEVDIPIILNITFESRYNSFIVSVDVNGNEDGFTSYDITQTPYSLNNVIGNISSEISKEFPHEQYRQSYLSITDHVRNEIDTSDNYNNIMESTFNSIGNILNVEVFPGITIGLIIGLPLLLGLFLIILKLIRG